ncbi:MAG: hypothetical protein ACE5KZ_16830 [Candidatus Scalinduaceae bacterium]
MKPVPGGVGPMTITMHMKKLSSLLNLNWESGRVARPFPMPNE